MIMMTTMMMMMIRPDSYKVLATQAWGPWLNSQNPVKRQLEWCPLVILCWEGRQKGPWGLMTSQPSLLGEQRDSGRFYFKSNVDSIWRTTPEVDLWTRMHTGMHTHKHTCSRTLKSTHTFTQTFYLNLAFSLLVAIYCDTPTQLLPFSGLLKTILENTKAQSNVSAGLLEMGKHCGLDVTLWCRKMNKGEMKTGGS